MRWQDSAHVIHHAKGSRAELLEGGGVHRVELRWPAVPKLTAAELERAEQLMREWDERQTTNEAKEAA